MKHTPSISDIFRLSAAVSTLMTSRRNTRVSVLGQSRNLESRSGTAQPGRGGGTAVSRGCAIAGEEQRDISGWLRCPAFALAEMF